MNVSDTLAAAVTRRIKLASAVRELRRHASGTEEQGRCYDVETATIAAVDAMVELTTMLEQVRQLVAGAWNPTTLMKIGELLGIDRWEGGWISQLLACAQIAQHKGPWLMRKGELLKIGRFDSYGAMTQQLDGVLTGWEFAAIDSEGDRVDMERTYGWKL